MSSVIGVAAIIEGLNRGVIGRIQALGSKVFILSRLPAGTFGRPREDIRLRKHFRFSDARRIEESSPSAEYVSAFTTRAAFFGDSNNVRYRNEQVTNVIVRGVDHNYSAAIPMFDVSEGRTISRYDQDHARTVAVIGQGIAAALFPRVDPIGKTIRLNGLPSTSWGCSSRMRASSAALESISSSASPTGHFTSCTPRSKSISLRFPSATPRTCPGRG